MTCLLLCLSLCTFSGVALQDYWWAPFLCSWDLAFWMWLLKATGLALLTLGAAECREAGKHPWPCFWLPAPDPYKHGLFPDDAATEGRLGTGKVAATAGEVLTVTSVMAPLCLSPVYDQPWDVFFPSGVCPLQLHPISVLPFPWAQTAQPWLLLCVCLEVGRQKLNPILLSPWVTCGIRVFSMSRVCMNSSDRQDEYCSKLASKWLITLVRNRDVLPFLSCGTSSLIMLCWHQQEWSS